MAHNMVRMNDSRYCKSGFQDTEATIGVNSKAYTLAKKVVSISLSMFL